jgi:hypothetical protein
MAEVTSDPHDPRVKRGRPDETPVPQHDVEAILAELRRSTDLLNPFLTYGMERVAANELRRRRNICALTNYLAAHPCACGESDPVALDFDHREKVGGARSNVSALAAGASLLRLAQEIIKCDVRCANCHRKRTAVQLRWHSYLSKRPFKEADGSHN